MRLAIILYEQSARNAVIIEIAEQGGRVGN